MFHAETDRAAETAEVLAEDLGLFFQGRRELGFVGQGGQDKFTSGGWAAEELKLLVDAYGNPIFVTHADTAEQMADAEVFDAHGWGHARTQTLSEGEAVVVNMKPGTQSQNIFRYLRRP